MGAGLAKDSLPSYTPNHELSSALRPLWLLSRFLLHISAVDVRSESRPFWADLWAGHHPRGE